MMRSAKTQALAVALCLLATVLDARSEGAPPGATTRPAGPAPAAEATDATAPAKAAGPKPTASPADPTKDPGGATAPAKPVRVKKPEPPAVKPTGTSTGKPAADEPADPATDSAMATPARYTSVVATMTLKVVNPKDARERIEVAVKRAGGFAVLVTDHELRLKLPPGALSAMLDEVSDEGLLIEKSMERRDLTLEVNKLEGQLRSKRSILTELRGFFDSSNVAATLQIERSMTELVDELERVKGALRVLHDQASWAVLRVHFQFRERDRIQQLTSEFEWLNSVNLDRFLEEF